MPKAAVEKKMQKELLRVRTKKLITRRRRRRNRKVNFFTLRKIKNKKSVMTEAYKSIESEDKKFLNCHLASD